MFGNVVPPVPPIPPDTTGGGGGGGYDVGGIRKDKTREELEKKLREDEDILGIILSTYIIENN